MHGLNKEDVVEVIKKWLGTGSINIFGLQFSGKDTQAEKLCSLLGCSVIGGGDILRASTTPQRVQDALEVGDLVPTQDYLDIVVPYLSKPEFNGKPLIFSAVGRWIGEEVSVLRATEKSHHPIKAVLLLQIPEEVAFERLDSSDRGRDDDHHDNLKRRIEEFKNKTIPVIEVYKEMGLLIEIDATEEPDAVHEAILQQLYQKART